MSIKRSLVKVDTPPVQPGFLGNGHIARPVIQLPFATSDPFIMLMDDMLDKKDTEPAGGPHPHAGFETVSLLIEGEMGEAPNIMKAGDFEMMTAGSGIVHTETIVEKTKMRLLQLWLNLPKKDRWTEPRVQLLHGEYVPEKSGDGINIKLYSGSLAGMESPVKNYTSLILADIKIGPGITTIKKIPANFNTFLYVIAGSLKVGEEEKVLDIDQVGWLDMFSDDKQSVLKLKAGNEGVRFVLYAGKPTGDNIIVHGPFVADAPDEISDLYREYRHGKIKHISTIAEEHKITY